MCGKKYYEYFFMKNCITFGKTYSNYLPTLYIPKMISTCCDMILNTFIPLGHYYIYSVLDDLCSSRWIAVTGRCSAIFELETCICTESILELQPSD